ncbi:MAG: hypothetical protein R3C12_22305 [Planctomycetaceae bacterium]
MFDSYPLPACYDELLTADHQSRFPTVTERLQQLSFSELAQRQHTTEERLRDLGITFAVYGHQDGTEKVWPFDILPRVIGAEEWQTVEQGVEASGSTR